LDSHLIVNLFEISENYGFVFGILSSKCYLRVFF
jgi:hypothetical protein